MRRSRKGTRGISGRCSKRVDEMGSMRERKKAAIQAPDLEPKPATYPAKRKSYFALFFLLVIGFLMFGIKAAVFLESKNPEAPSEYMAVYLTTGDIYYGKYKRFPVPQLND